MPPVASGSKPAAGKLTALESKIIKVGLAAKGGSISQQELLSQCGLTISSTTQDAMNTLLRKNLAQMLKNSKGEIEFRFVGKDEAKAMGSMDSEEKLVFDAIKSAGNMGIWTKSLTTQTGLPRTTITKVLKTLEGRKTVKTVKSVKAPTRKIYMLSNLTPSVELTGGPWFTDNELDTEFVELLKKCAYKYLQDNSIPRPSKGKRRIFPVSATSHLPTVQQVLDYIDGLQVAVAVELQDVHVQALLDLMVYDGTVEKIFINSDMAINGGAHSSSRTNGKGKGKGKGKKRSRAARSDDSSDDDDAPRRKRGKKAANGRGGKKAKGKKKSGLDGDDDSEAEDSPSDESDFDEDETAEEAKRRAAERAEEGGEKKSSRRKKKRQKRAAKAEDSDADEERGNTSESSGHSDDSDDEDGKKKGKGKIPTLEEEREGMKDYVYRLVHPYKPVIGWTDMPCGKCPSEPFCTEPPRPLAVAQPRSGRPKVGIELEGGIQGVGMIGGAGAAIGVSTAKWGEVKGAVGQPVAPVNPRDCHYFKEWLEF